MTNPWTPAVMSQLRDRTRGSCVVGAAALALTLGVLAVLAPTGGARTARHDGGPLARVASPTGDCDNDGDPIWTDFEECSPAPIEPGKTFSPAEKAQFYEQAQELNKHIAEMCGNGPEYPVWWLIHYYSVFAPRKLIDTCNYLEHFQIPTLNAMYADPPDPSVFLVALPLVPPASEGQSASCNFGTRKCRRGGQLAAAYVYADGQVTAAMDALETSVNRLSSTPSGPESQFGSGAGSAPLYSRRTQVAAVRLYSGLVAAWTARLGVARVDFIHFLDGIGGEARRAAKHMQPVLRTAPLWRTYHAMNIFEIAQLFSDLTAQNFLGVKSQPGGQLKLELEFGYLRLQQDMYAVYLGTRGPHRTRAQRIAAAATRFRRDANKFARIPGLATFFPNAPLSAQLFGFAVEGMTSNQPVPVAAP